MAGLARRLQPVLPGDTARRGAASLVAAASIEVSARDAYAGERLREHFPCGTRVFVAYPGSVSHHDIVAACVRLRRAGFAPVPHVAARRLLSFTQADDFLRRAVGEAGVTGALLIGGDADPPAGPFADSLSLLASGIVERNGIGCVGFAGHPEGHPAIARRTLAAALGAKIALAREAGLAVEIITQFGFDAAPIGRWVADLRAGGFAGAVRIGIAGPATIATLAKYAVRCGVGNSLRALARGQVAFARILTEASPDALIDALVAGENETGPIDGLHIFSFGGLKRTAQWAAAHRV